MMSDHELSRRIQALEAKINRLQTFNQIILDHLLGAQHYSGPGLGPNPQNVHQWVVGLSNEIWQNYQHTTKL
jgi:hypothetical protein